MAHASGHHAAPHGGGRAKRRGVNGVVCFVAALFVGLWSVTVFVAVLPWLQGSVGGVEHVALLSVLTGSALGLYLRVVYADPGSVPQGWLPDAEAAAAAANGQPGGAAPPPLGSLFVEVKRKGDAVRYCSKCSHHKPARAHHCRQCERCVLRMDHHCAWVNNCVGHGNYRAFLFFLAASSAALAHCAALLAARLLRGGAVRVRAEARSAARGSAGEAAALADGALASAALLVFALVLALLLLAAVGTLLGWHVWLAGSNMTTIEFHEGVRARRAGQAGDGAAWRRARHIYDRGVAANCHAALGGSPAGWLAPCCCAAAAVEGDGLAFATAPD